MNIKILHSWLLEFLDTKATPQQIQQYVSLCGPSIESVEKISDDWVYDIEITSNRIDTVSVVGIARETATILNRFNIPAQFKKPNISEPPLPTHTLPFFIQDDKRLCKRLMAVVMDHVIVGNSPEIIKKRLETAGIRSISNLVDITNYVMLEVGHPTHVFDYDRIKTNTFILRNAKKEEKITTLDEKTYILFETDIIIDDGTGRVIDLPGIMGTANSVVTEDTKRIVFFIESNNPQAIRKSSMKHGIRTMAASINEKNPHPDLVKEALFRGIELFNQYANANVASSIFDIYPGIVSPKKIFVDISFIQRKIGLIIKEEQIKTILTDLEFKVKNIKGMLEIEVPAFRYFDVSEKEDIVEEIARIYGYHNIPGKLPPLTHIKQPIEIERFFYFQNIVKTFLKHQVFHEVLNYSAYSSVLLEKFDLKETEHLYITNTISQDFKYLRISLIPSLIKNLKDNEGFSNDFNLFEIAKTYIPQQKNLPEERFKLSFVTKKSFLYCKGILESLLKELHITNYSFTPSSHPYFAKTMQAELCINSISVGVFGKIKNTITNKFQFSSSVFTGEFDFGNLIENARLMPVYKPFNPHAAIQLDLTIIKNQPYSEIICLAMKSAPHLTHISLKDTYKDNITLHLVFSSPKRNYTENEALIELNNIKEKLLRSVT